MRLTKLTILALKGMDVATRNRFARELNVTRRTVDRWIAANHDSLTKAAALVFIRELTGMTDEQILEVEKPGQ